MNPKILKVLGLKHSHPILRELNKKPKGMGSNEIDYGVVQSSRSNSDTLKQLREMELVIKGEGRVGKYYITQKGKDILPHLESILKIDKKKYTKQKEIKLSLIE